MERDKPHIILDMGNVIPSPYIKKGGGNSVVSTYLDRKQHAYTLSKKLDNLCSLCKRSNYYTIKFVGDADTGLLQEAIDKIGFGITLLSIKQDNGKITQANLKIDTKKAFNKLQDALCKYAEKTEGLSYIGSINDISKVQVEDLFLDDMSFFPKDDASYSWELWFASDDDDTLATFSELASQFNIIDEQKHINFVDRIVVFCKATVGALRQLIESAKIIITEIHLVRALSPQIFDLPVLEQEQISVDLLNKLELQRPHRSVVTILDQGMIVRHPLLKDIIDRNLIAIDTLSPSTNNEHTTAVGSLVSFGDLAEAINTNKICIPYKIESVQLTDERVCRECELWGRLTEEAVKKTLSDKNLYVMTISAENTSTHYGEPTSWSAKIDDICFENKKIFSLAVGNFVEIINKEEYENHQEQSCVENPAQSWNSIAIGAFTNMDEHERCLEGNVYPLARKGDLSPYSKTSNLFQKGWPLKPEVVFEGGNRCVTQSNDVWNGEEFFNLTVCSDTFQGSSPYFKFFAMTSASAGLAGRFLGQLSAVYPNLWPETIRALLIHSADHTERMKARLPKKPKQEDFTHLLRKVGYGVPDIQKARYSASNSLSLIIEKEFQAYTVRQGKEKKKVCQIMFFDMNWPADFLMSDDIKDKKIKIKFTLSYFIKPNPSSRGYKNNFSYQSHNLRFDIQAPTETDDAFKTRVGLAVESEENAQNAIKAEKLNWKYGVKSQMRTAGSIHQDELEVTAADLASMKNVAVYSVGGWWKDRKSISPKDTMSRFSLVISLDAGENEIDLYTQIKNTIAIENKTTIAV